METISLLFNSGLLRFSGGLKGSGKKASRSRDVARTKKRRE